MKQNAIKDLVKGTHNDTQLQNNVHPKYNRLDCDWVAADQCTMLHGTLLHIMK